MNNQSLPVYVGETGPELFIPRRVSDASTEYARALDDLSDSMARAMKDIGNAFRMDGLSVRHLEVTHSLLDQIGFEYESEPESCPYCATSSTRVNLRGQVECSGCGSPR